MCKLWLFNTARRLRSHDCYTNLSDTCNYSEQSLQDSQVHSHQLQQQLQLQQAQLLQQQTEIVNLRAVLEVEQRQSAMLLQQQSAAAASAPHFGRRVSLDGELNGSFLMVETSSAFNNSTGNLLASSLGDGSSAMMGTSYPHGTSSNTSSFNTVGTVSATSLTPSNASFPSLSRNFESSSHNMAMNAALPPTSAGITANSSTPAHASFGGMASLNQQSGYEVEVTPRMIHRGSSGSISGAGNRMSMHGDPFGSSGPQVLGIVLNEGDEHVLDDIPYSSICFYIICSLLRS